MPPEAQESFNEQRVLYEWEMDNFIPLSLPFLEALGAKRLQSSAWRREGNDPALPHSFHLGWRKGRSRHAFKTRAHIRAIDYVDGEPDEGTPVVYQMPDEGRSWSRSYDLNVDGLKVSQKVIAEIKLHDAEWDEYNGSVSFGITNRTSVKAEASGGVSGIGEGSVTAESETTTSLNTSFGTAGGERHESTRMHRDETTVEDIPQGKKILLECDIGKSKSVTEIAENAYIEAEIEFDLYDWAENRAPYLKDSIDEGANRIKSNTIQDIIWFIEGQRPAEYPNMRKFLPDMRARAKKGDKVAKGALKFYEWLKDQENRHVRLTRTRVKVSESAGTLRARLI